MRSRLCTPGEWSSVVRILASLVIRDAIVRTAPSPSTTDPSESVTARWAAALSAADGSETTLWAAIAELPDAGVLASGSRTNPVLRAQRSATRVLRLMQYTEWRIDPHPWTLERYVEWYTDRSNNLPR